MGKEGSPIWSVCEPYERKEQRGSRKKRAPGMRRRPNEER